MRLIDDERRRLLSLNQRSLIFLLATCDWLMHAGVKPLESQQIRQRGLVHSRGPWYGPAAGTINEGCSNDNVDGSLLPSRRVVRLSSRHRDAGRCLGGVCLVSPSAGHMVLCYARCRHGFVLRPMSTPLTHLSFNTYGEFPFSHCRFTHTLTH